jgi:hypothetical protein
VHTLGPNVNANTEAASFPRAMRWLGWLLALAALFYPIDVLRAWRHLVGYPRPSMPEGEAAQAGAFWVDVSTTIAHTGLLGWFGSVACLLGMVWIFTASLLWIDHRVHRRALARSSRMVFFAVCGAVALAYACYHYLWHVHGVVVSEALPLSLSG